MKIGSTFNSELYGPLKIVRKRYSRMGNKSLWIGTDEQGEEHELDGSEKPAKMENQSPKLLKEAAEVLGMAQGPKGEDADEDYIIEAVIPRVLEMIRQPEDGKDGADADIELIIREMLPLVMEKMPQPEKINEASIVSKVLSRVRIPQDGTPGNPGKDGSPDTPKEVKEKLETLEGDERLDAKAIKNLPRSFGPSVGGVSRLQDLSDVTLSSPSNNQSLTYDSATGKWVNETVSGGSVTLAGEDYLSLAAQEITANAIDLDNLSATGTPSAATFLRGDNTWATPAGSGDVSKVGTPANNQLAVWTGDGTLEGTGDVTFDGTSLNIATAKNLQIAGSTVLADAAGTTTLSNIDALDATTEATVENAIDSLDNLTSIQGRTVTLTEAGADAIFGWDFSESKYENLTQGEARTVLGLGTAAYVATDLADLNEATIEGAIDTLPNLTSIQGRTVTLADAGADALLGWDDSASAYQNLSAADVRTALALVVGTNVQAYDADLTTWAGVTPGTGIATALAVNVGSAGAPVINGGALGTPSSGVATNLTGTASGLTAGTVTTNANLTGPVTSTGNATAIADAALSIAKTSGLQTALDAKAPLASPTFTGTVTHAASTITGNQNIAALPASDHTANGPTTSIFNLGATVALMETVYLGSGGKWLLTDASATGTADKMLGICLDGGADTDTTTIALAGSFVRDDTWNWTTIGGAIYLSETAGALTQTAPTTTDAVVRVVGYATSADTLWFMPETGVVHT